jgi:hypothetical protein
MRAGSGAISARSTMRDQQSKRWREIATLSAGARLKLKRRKGFTLTLKTKLSINDEVKNGTMNLTAIDDKLRNRHGVGVKVIIQVIVVA